MKAKDTDAFEKVRAQNTDPYGRTTIAYAMRWADLMEAELAKGAKLQDVAADTSHAADIDHISGFMHGLAVSILVKHWEHGEALGQWRENQQRARA